VTALADSLTVCNAAAAAAAGKDYRDSVLKDARSSLIVFAGGDPDLRQAVTDGKVEQVSSSAGVHSYSRMQSVHGCLVCEMCEAQHEAALQA
jgi:hypothetical protein